MKKGFISLMTILLVSATALIISSTILLKSITETTVSSDEEFSNRAWSAVNACGEYALVHLAVASTTGYASTTNGWNYQGQYELTDLGADGDSCYIYPIDISGGASSTRLIMASSTVNDFTRKISIVVATNTPVVEVTSWELVADF